ncbi:MAG: DUF2802 domain-containing protein [Zoogloeaceae bacterium]|jgi:hypothetical protein|nr:DUF2802 domain-containing protein [Zoogloeaceae bacterium]
MNLLGWREILLTLILLIVLYMLWLIWRMRRIGRPSPSPSLRRDEPRVSLSEPSLFSETPMAQEPQDDDDEEVLLTYPHPRTRPHRHNPFPSSAAATPAASPVDTDADAAARQDFARQAIMAGVEREVGQLRDEMDALRGAFAALRSDMQALHDAFEQEVQNLHTAQNASPLYSDAMQMAMLGHDAITIAERCGISRAEAELVVALVKNKDRA